MILGKALRVFAATLVFTSSISYATGEGTGTNSPPTAPVDPAPVINPLVFPTAEVTSTRPDGEIEVLSMGSAAALSVGESEQLKEYVDLKLKENVREGGHPTVLVLNPDQESREFAAEAASSIPANSVTITEKVLPKIWNDHANSIWNKVKNQVRIDPDYKERAKKFGASYWHDMASFYAKDGKGYDKFIIKVSLFRITVNTLAPFLVALVSHGFSNVAAHVAFLPYLELGMSSGLIFTYLSPFIPWNRSLPRPSDTIFWKGVEILVQASFYLFSEDLFIDMYRGTQYISNVWALSRSETPQFKIMGAGENWGIPGGVAFKSSVGQAPLDLSFGQIFKMGIKEQDALLKANPELAEQVHAAKTKLLNTLALNGTIVSVYTNLAALAGPPHSFISRVAFTFLYMGAAVVVGRAFAPGQIPASIEKIQDYVSPKPMSLRDLALKCNSDLDFLHSEN